jgi:uncharacterized protein (DUF983 family)
MADANPEHEGQPGIVPAALFGLCPRCGARTLFAGLTQFAPRCRACGLDIESYNVGDGPAAFLTMVIGALIVGLALWLELTVHPPFWVHALLWIPITTGAVIWGLRAGKSALLAAEHQRNAREAGAKDLRGE